MPVPSYPAASEARRTDGFLRAPDGVRLYWQRYTPPGSRAAVAVLPGGGDHSGRYPALTAALVRAGLDVSLVDFRGHGQSDGRRWHVDAFSEYVGDAQAFLAQVRAGANGRLVFVVGHSQGGLVAAWLGLTPEGRSVAGYVLSSPYFQLALDPPRLKLWGAQLVGRVVPWLPISTGLRYEDLTSDEELQRWTEADPLYGRATTPRWFVESRRAQQEILRRAGDFRSALLVLLGDADRIASPEAGRRFQAASASRDKALRTYTGFRHELFNETGRERPIADAVAWITERAAPSRPR